MRGNFAQGPWVWAVYLDLARHTRSWSSGFGNLYSFQPVRDTLPETSFLQMSFFIYLALPTSPRSTEFGLAIFSNFPQDISPCLELEILGGPSVGFFSQRWPLFFVRCCGEFVLGGWFGTGAQGEEGWCLRWCLTEPHTLRLEWRDVCCVNQHGEISNDTLSDFQSHVYRVVTRWFWVLCRGFQVPVLLGLFTLDHAHEFCASDLCLYWLLPLEGTDTRLHHRSSACPVSGLTVGLRVLYHLPHPGSCFFFTQLSLFSCHGLLSVNV